MLDKKAVAGTDRPQPVSRIRRLCRISARGVNSDRLFGSSKMSSAEDSPRNPLFRMSFKAYPTTSRCVSVTAMAWTLQHAVQAHVVALVEPDVDVDVAAQPRRLRHEQYAVVMEPIVD